MKKLFLFLFCAALICSCAPKPEAKTIDLEPFLTEMAADSLTLHSVMVMQGGGILASQWLNGAAADQPHVMHSVSKSFTATAVGFAVAEGLFSLDDTVASFFPDKLPAEPGADLLAMTVRNLLTMSTGQLQQPSREGDDWLGNFFAEPVVEAPGTNFRYSSMATFMLSAIVQKTSGEKITDYLQTRLFGPLGITGYRWDESPEGIPVGGWGLYIKTEDMLRFGQLFLQKGVWNGTQLLPDGWVELASSWQIASGPAGNETFRDPDSDWTQGYGFQMWICRHGAYRADGARGQFIVVMPEKDAVVAMTADIGDMQAQLNLVWKHLLPQL